MTTEDGAMLLSVKLTPTGCVLTVETIPMHKPSPPLPPPVPGPLLASSRFVTVSLE